MAVKAAASKTPPAPSGSARKQVSSRTSRSQENGETGSGSMSKADVFDNTKASGHVEPGKYVAIIANAVLQKPDEKGQSVRFEYEIASEGDYRGQRLAQFYKCFEADETPGKGLAFLKRDLAILGYEDVKFAELEDLFAEIGDKKTGVNITVKQNDQFTNVYLNGLCEDESVVEEYLATRTF